MTLTVAHTLSPTQEMQNALTRGLKLVTQCATQGPFYSLLHDGEISCEFVNCAIDLGQALAKAGCSSSSEEGSCSRAGTVNLLTLALT